MRGLPLAVASGGHSSSRCAGLSLSWPFLLRSTGFRRAGSAVMAHGLSCSAACGIFPDQGYEPVSPALAGRLSTPAPPGKPQALFLDRGQFCLPGDTGQCLGTFVIVTSWGEQIGGHMHYRHLVGRALGGGLLSLLRCPGWPPPQRIIWPTGHSAEVEKPWVRAKISGVLP